MHPVMRQQLAAERAKDMTAKVDDRRRARQARRARQSRTSRLMTWFGLPRTHTVPGRPSANAVAPHKEVTVP